MVGGSLSAAPLHERSARTPRIGVLAAGEGSNLQALLDAVQSGDLVAEIAVVVSHRPGARALERAREAGIPAVTLPLTDRRDSRARAAFERDLLDLLHPFHPDLIVLAGWMAILSRGFLVAIGCPLLNVHPALLDATEIPVLRGIHAVRDALRHRLPYTGVSVHHVTPEVDAGPVVLSQAVPILPDDTEDTLYRRIKEVEHRLLPRAAQSVLCSFHSGGIHA